MKNKIPFSLLPFNILRKISSVFYGLGNMIQKGMPSMRLNLEKAEINVSPQEYIAMCLMSSLIFFVFCYMLLNIFLYLFVGRSLILSFFVSIIVTLFVLIEQISYPKLKGNRKTKDVERNLLPALRDMVVQLNSGVSLFSILVNISKEDYGAISKEFEKVVRKINAGIPEVEVLEELATQNPSLHFRRALWQLVNGMKTGSDTAIVVKNIIGNLSEEQLIQVQRYGGQLNPLAMFYLLITIIVPSLGATFLTVIFTFISSSGFVAKSVYWALYGFVFFFQIIFLGIIKTRRPTLLEE